MMADLEMTIINRDFILITREPWQTTRPLLSNLSKLLPSDCRTPGKEELGTSISKEIIGNFSGGKNHLETV